MSLWLVRAGSAGEYESKYLSDKKIYLTWDGLSANLSKLNDRQSLYDLLIGTYPDVKRGTYINWTGQIWPFVKKMKTGDWVALPSKKKASIHIGEITGDYVYDPKAADPFFHFRSMKWFATDIPRLNFDQDILYSLGAFMTICRISRNDAENRVKQMSKNQWKSLPVRSIISDEKSEEAETAEYVDIERAARDQIAKFIISRFKGHGMTRLIDAILRAQGYFTFRSPEGPDKGVDLLASTGPLGFGDPRICVQVKTGDSPVDRPTLDQLIGTMQNFSAQQGLLVSWSGFKNTVDKEVPSQFFRVRLWDQDQIIEQLLRVYDKIDEEIKAEIPLKKFWSLTISESE